MTNEARSLFWVPRDDTRYTYAVAVIRALERTLLGRKTLEAMARASSPEEALEELGETSYSKFMLPGQVVEGLEPLLERVLHDTYSLFRTLVLDEDLEQAILLPHDYHNLKALIKARLGNEMPKGVVPYGLLDADTIASALESDSYGDLPEGFGQTAKEALHRYGMEADPRRLEIALDQAAMRCKIDSLGALDSPVIPDYSQQLADTTNIRLAIRLNHSDPDPEVLEIAYTEGGTIPSEILLNVLGKNPRALIDALSASRYAKALRDGIDYLQEKGSYAVLDRELENELILTLRGARFLIFGPGPVLAHTLAKEHETAMVRLVMVAKMNRIPAERIVARLPLLYV